MSTRVPHAVTWALLALAAWLGLYQLNVIVGLTAERGFVFGKPATLTISFTAAVLCFAGAWRRRGAARWAWTAIAVGIVAWNAGDTYWTAVLVDRDVIPVPSWADAGYLAFPALVFGAVSLLMRPAFSVTSRLLIVDGVAAGLAVGALVASAIIGKVLEATDGVLVNLSYPVSDVVILGLVVGSVAVRGWRLDRTWALVGGAIIAFWVADTNYLITLADGSYEYPNPVDFGWSACFVLLAAAAWQPTRPVAPVARLGRRATLAPLLFAGLALAVLAQAGLSGGSPTAVVLAVASLLAVGVRLLVTFTAHVAMLDGSRREALTDPLTGLGNRRALLEDLRDTVRRASAEHPRALVLYDLDGFKHYNDSFGHPAGDALLRMLGRRLADASGSSSRAYRMGGDEFCLLVATDTAGLPAVSKRGAAALRDEGGGYSIGASYGAVVLPVEAQDAEHALRVADQRMYAHKHGGRASAGRQVSDVLVRALVERDGELGDHVRDVGLLAIGVARRLGLDAEQCELVTQAAVLHDVGKVAISDAILDKPGPLDDREWGLMRRHTLMGERIIGAAPAMRGVADVVRSSHERWDGTGYPDGLAGEAIPLGARVVAVCDAFDAMRTSRSYSPALSEEDALEELVRGRGTQFDPAIVDAFCAESTRARRVPVRVG